MKIYILNSKITNFCTENKASMFNARLSFNKNGSFGIIKCYNNVKNFWNKQTIFTIDKLCQVIFILNYSKKEKGQLNPYLDYYV